MRLSDWPNCATPDCEHKRCLWSDTDLCYPCATRILGSVEMVRRYNATHEEPWPPIMLQSDFDRAWNEGTDERGA